MSGPAVVFREAHRLRKFIQNLREQLDALPTQLKKRRKAVTDAEDAHRAGHEGIEKLKVDVRKKEGEFRDLQLKVQKFERQLNEIQSKKEYDALQLEIRNTRAECDRLENEVIEKTIEAEDRAGKLPDEAKKVQEAKDVYAKFEADAEARKADLELQLQTSVEQLKAVEANVPEELRQDYNRKVTKGADAFSAVRDRTCTACYTEITVQMRTDLTQQMFVACKSCGRLLYLAE